ncbi:MAG TPA: hypothetical protein VH703_04145 [Solirubrobacterales bacterium]|jgi:hypothetical protein
MGALRLGSIERMIFGQVGPFTSLIEGAATAAGAGMLLGGFATGLRGVLAGHPRPTLEGRALEGAYLGGVGGAAAIVTDMVVSYFV